MQCSRGLSNIVPQGLPKHGKVILIVVAKGSVAASTLELLRLDDDRRQRLSSDFVAQWAATFRVMRSHTDALATETGSRKGAVRECTPSSMLKKDVTLLEPFVQCWMVGQSGRVPSTPIYRNPFLPEPSSNILPETSRNLKKSVELSGLFWTILDPSRSFFCTAVLAQRAHWYMCRL